MEIAVVAEPVVAIQDLLRTMLAREGYEVRVAFGVGGVRAQLEDAPRVLIVDTAADDFLEILALVRALDAPPHVIVTGTSEPETDLGGLPFLLKPFTSGRLARLLPS